MEDLSDLEKLFQLNIVVYSLGPSDENDDSHDSDSQDETPNPGVIVARIVRRSHRRYAETMYLNLYEHHFSYIKNIKSYCKSFQCSKCGTFWKHAGKLHRHERTCEAKTHFRYPGGAYVPPPSIHDKLKDEGIDIPDELLYFKYFATFDFESMFDKNVDLPNNSAKVTWQNKHIPLSVSICSNVPGYQEPKCFITSGDSHELIKQFGDQLVEISSESHRLLLNDFENVFAAIDERIGETAPAAMDDDDNDDDIEQMVDLLVSLQDDSVENNPRGIDIMLSDDDDDDDEEITEENEDDRMFIDDDDDDVEVNDANFYRALDREISEVMPSTVTSNETNTEPAKERKRPHPLIALKVRFAY